MQKAIQAALGAFLSSFTQTSGIDTTGILSELSSAFKSNQDFMAKVAAVDKVIDAHPKLEELREYIIDLLFIHFFTDDVKKLEEDYLDSPEWEAIEEETLDRGTELLNVLLYLKECHDEDIEPELSDFLKEFLLVDEDEFQDEHEIYREVILLRNQIDSAFPPMMEVLMKKKDESPLGSMFIPLFVLFYYPEELEFASAQLAKYADSLEEEQAVFAMIRGFVEGLK